MNEQALNYSYELFKKDGYTGTLDQYRQLISSDKKALDYSFNLFKNDGYSGSIDDFNGLISPAVESPMAIKPTADEQKKNRSSVSPFVDGGSELTRFDPSSGQVVQETPEFTKPSVKPQAPQQPKPTETIMYGPMGAMGLQRTKEYKPEYEGKSLPNVVGELGKTFAKGVVKFPADVLETAAIATTAARNLAAKTGLVDESTATQVGVQLGGANVNFFQAASEWKNLVNEFIPTDKDIESGFWGQTATALGQMVPVILTGGISGGGRAIAKEAGKKGLSMQAVANYGKEVVSRMGSAQGILTVSQVAAPSYEQAKRDGATENEAIGFALQNAVMTYPLEMLPVNNLFKRLDNVLVGNKGVEVLKRAVVGGAEEGITEGLQNIYENVTADAIYGTTREILDGVGESTAVGGTVGTIMNGLLTALLGRRARATSETEIEQLDKSIEEVQQKVNQVESNNKAIEKTITEIEETKPRKLSYGSADYNFIESKNGDLEYADDALTEQQAQGVVSNLTNSYKKIDFTIEEVEPEDPYQPTTYKIIGKPKTIQQDAIQEQAAGQVPVQSGTRVSQEVAQGEPQAEPQGVTQEGQEVIPQEEIDLETQLAEDLKTIKGTTQSRLRVEGIDIPAEEDINLETIESNLDKLPAYEVNFTTPEVSQDIQVNPIEESKSSTKEGTAESRTIESFQGVPMIVGMSDTLAAGTVVDSMGNPMEVEGGLLYNVLGKNKNAAWAGVTEEGARIQYNEALELYNNNKNIFEKLWAEGKLPNGHVPMAIMRMADTAVNSNEAVFRYLSPLVKSQPEANQQAALDALKGDIEVKKKVDQAATVKSANKLDQFISSKNINSLGQLLDAIVSDANSRAKGDTENTLSLSERSLLFDLMVSPKGTKAASKNTVNALFGAKKDPKSKSFLADNIYEAIGEPAMLRIPRGNVAAVVGVDVLNGGVVPVEHGNYGFGPKGQMISLISNPKHGLDVFPEWKAKAVRVFKKTKPKKGEGKLPTASAIADEVGGAFFIDSAFRNAKVSMEPSDIELLAAKLRFAFPDVTVSNSQEEFDRVLQEEGVRTKESDGKVILGLTKDGKVYLNPDSDSLATPIHEFGHIWIDFLRSEASKEKGDALLAKGLSLVEGTKALQQAIAKYGDNALAREEALVELMATKGEDIINKSKKKEFKNWLNALFKYVKEFFTTTEQLFKGKDFEKTLKDMSLDDFINIGLADLLKGKAISSEFKAKDAGKGATELRFRVGDNITSFISKARAQGFSEDAIKNVLTRSGVDTDAINEALGKQTPAAKKVEVTEEFAPGYDRMIGELEGVVEKSLKRGTTQAKAMENAINYLQGTKVYENATDVQREQMVRDVNKRFKKREKRAPSAEKVVGKPKKKEVTVDEMVALKDQIKLEARAAREAKGDLNDKRKALAAKVSALKGKGTVTTNQLDTIIRRIEKTNLDNPIMVDRLLEYIEKVFDNANYAADMTELRKLQRQARTKKHTSMKNLVDKFTSINPELIPLDRIQDYKEALDFLNNRTPSYARMNEMLPEIESYKNVDEFDAVKTLEDLEKKYESIKLNKVASVEDYVALIKDINSFKRKADQLLENGDIDQEKYDEFIKLVGEDQAAVEKEYSKEIAKIKKDLIAEIKNQRPKVNRDFSNEENDLIRRYLELSDADLESLSPENLFILNDLLENISNGEIDVYRFAPIVSKAYTSSGLDPLAKQVNSSKFNKSSEEGRKDLAEQESAFWQGLLGMGRAKAGALQKFIVAPFNRAIASYENFNKKSYSEFLNLKNKYKIKNKDMHKIGILTTYLQEYMSQFDPENKGIKNIGSRDWFKEILNSREMRDNYSSGKPSILKTIGLGSSELDIIKEIWDSLPKDSDGNVDPKAVYDSYMANDGKFFSKNEKGFFDAVMAYKADAITPKQKAANELSGKSFKEIPFHMLRVRLKGGKDQVQPSASAENGNVRIKAGTGKERVSEKVGAVMTNFEKLFIAGVEQTGRDYFLSGALQDINNTLSGVKKIVGDSKIELMNTISYTLSDALKFEFDRVKTNFIFRNLLSARAAMTLFRPIRTAVELGSTLISYPVRSKTLSGYKSLFGEQGAMKKLLEFTDSPMLLRENISKAIDINQGKIEPQGRFTKATNYLSGLPERTMMVTSWMPTFKSEFKDITGIDFDINKFNDSQAYREKYGKAIRESSAVADAQTEKIIGPTTKAGQRREVRIAPKFLANLFGAEGTVSKNTAEGQILGFFSNYPFRESTEFINGFREAGEVLNEEGALSSLSQLQKPLGIALNVAAYGFLSTATYALGLMLLGDDDDEKRGEDLLKDLITGEGFLNELASNAISLAGSKYAAGGKAILQLAATILIESTDDEAHKARIKKLLKDSVFIDPLPVDKVVGFKGEQEVAGAIGKYIPQFIVAYARYADFIATKNELKVIYDKVDKNGIESLTEDEGLKVLALNTAFNGAQIVLNLFGTSIPEYNYIKTYMKGLKEEAGVADAYKGEAPAKKKSSSGGGSRGGGSKGINKTDLKRYYPEQYNELYGENSPGYEIQQEIKAFEKEQREFKKRMKDQIYGGKD
jgi:hypothetical protein